MSIFDWLGPLNTGGKARGWGNLPELKAANTAPRPINLTDPSSPIFYPTALVSTLTDDRSGASNSAVFACLQAIASGLGEAVPKVYRVQGGQKIEIDNDPLGALLLRPNPVFSMDDLLGYIGVSLHVDGNGYWRKLRAGNPLTGNVVQLWPISPGNIEPLTNNPDDFISSYRYTLDDGRSITLPTDQVVHFRYGIDDGDHRLGCAPLKRLLREISSDQQATRYADRLLANLAINGLSLSFDKDSPPIDQDTADLLKARIMAAYGGDNVGAAAVLSPGALLTQLGFSPEQMDLGTIHRVPEERICAVLGVPAAMVGLGVGLEHSIYNNVKQAEEHFTERKLLPTWSQLAATMTLQLVPDFTADPRVVVEFDTDEIRALADDQNALAVRLKTLVEAGIIDTDEARAEIGYEPRGTTQAPATVTVLPTVAASRRVERRALVAERKAAEEIPPALSRMRVARLPDWEGELLAYLERQRARIIRRLHAGADDPAELVPEGEAILLGETLAPLQLEVLSAVERLVVAELAVDFRLDDPATRQYLQSAGAHIVGITQTTRGDVQAALIEGQRAGEGIPQLARRLRDLPSFTQARANVVARTELGTSQNLAALTSYRASGVVVGVRVHDGDYDEACAAMDGRTFALDAAPPELQHPNCVRAFAPLTDAADLSGAA